MADGGLRYMVEAEEVVEERKGLTMQGTSYDTSTRSIATTRS